MWTARWHVSARLSVDDDFKSMTITGQRRYSSAMRINTACMTCVAETGQADPFFYPVEVRDDGLYTVKCRNGHDSVICLQEQKFEVLPELAVNAIIDGYFRDAVASFTAGMERFFEFYIRVIGRARKLSTAEFEAAWTQTASLSERQLGAYVVAHLIEEGTAPKLLSRKKIEFRNAVVHKGKIPTRVEAVNFGNAVFDVVLPPLTAIRKRYDDAVHAEVHAHLMAISESAREKNIRFSTMTIPTPISLTRSIEQVGTTVENTMERVAATRQLFT